MAANLLGFMGTDEPLGGFERTFDAQLAGKDGTARYTVGGGNRVPLGENSVVPARNGTALHTTIDLDLQWFTQRVLAQTIQKYRAQSGVAVVMDTRTGELLALADAPTFDANDPLEADKEDLGSRALSDAYEPGSVEKVLTAAALIDAGKVTPRQKFRVPPLLHRQDRAIGDWFDHGNIRLTMTGILAKSSNIGTVLAADAFTPQELTTYLRAFGLGARTDVGVRGESPGILTDGDVMTSQTKDRVAFGQSLSVNAVQMAAAVNTIANGGVRIAPSLIQGSATTDEGVEVGTDDADATRVVSEQAARQTARMMERVTHEGAGVGPDGRRPRLPRRRQDRHRAARRRRVRLLRRLHDGVVRRLRTGRRPALHGLRRRARTRHRRGRRHGRRTGVRQDPRLRPGPLRRPARPTASPRACPSSGDRAG